jgi:hypothetical protein
MTKKPNEEPKLVGAGIGDAAWGALGVLVGGPGEPQLVQVSVSGWVTKLNQI